MGSTPSKLSPSQPSSAPPTDSLVPSPVSSVERSASVTHSSAVFIQSSRKQTAAPHISASPADAQNASQKISRSSITTPVATPSPTTQPILSPSPSPSLQISSSVSVAQTQADSSSTTMTPIPSSIISTSPTPSPITSSSTSASHRAESSAGIAAICIGALILVLIPCVFLCRRRRQRAALSAAPFDIPETVRVAPVTVVSRHDPEKGPRPPPEAGEMESKASRRMRNIDAGFRRAPMWRSRETLPVYSP
ncbi:hypothetical protein DFH07DRAFT_578522 [Mycena maculata]|uniref:Uncharacterized protein n=1 Tax=Mycena maculata TaxID=230809 RepID=A0AAD7IQ02_9AGAR|nr:hypothetical protein DFH07DRAFT_578522 [Mycena maculata]